MIVCQKNFRWGTGASYTLMMSPRWQRNFSRLRVRPVMGAAVLQEECKMDHLGVSKNRGKTPQIIHYNRSFHYFHHPFWGFSPHFWKHPVVSKKMRVDTLFRWIWRLFIRWIQRSTPSIPESESWRIRLLKLEQQKHASKVWRQMAHVGPGVLEL